MNLASAWEMTVKNLSTTVSRDVQLRSVLAALEEQLAALDRLGAGIAAAHLDAAIQQLRRDAAGAD